MRWNKLGNSLAKGRPRSEHDIPFGASAIGYYGTFTEIGHDALEDFRHLGNWRGNQDEIGIADFVGRVDPGSIDDSQLLGQPQSRRRPAEADHLIHRPRLLEGQCEGTADQAGAEDDDLAKLGHYSAFSSASKKRVFSGSVPMVTRSHSGRP